jgi:hypothetical protein
MSPVDLLAQARADGAEFTIINGKLATRGVPAELRPTVLAHRAELVALLSAVGVCGWCNGPVTNPEVVHIGHGQRLHRTCGHWVRPA